MADSAPTEPAKPAAPAKPPGPAKSSELAKPAEPPSDKTSQQGVSVKKEQQPPRASPDVAAEKKPEKKPVKAAGTPGALPTGVSFSPEGKGPAVERGATKEVEARRKSSWGTFSRVVACAIDSSVCARYAFEWYLNNVWQKDDLIVLIHIPESPTLSPVSLKAGFHPPVEEWKKSLDKMNTKMRKLEEEFEGECIKRKLKFKIRGESFKNPGEGICVIAEDEQADLIVIGCRGVSAMKRALIGSTSEFVVRHAGIPCLVVRAKKLQ